MNAGPTTFLIGILRVIKEVIMELVKARDLEVCPRKCILYFEDFLADEKTRYSLITAVRQRNPQVPWKDMAGMRDWLIHGYFGIDNEIVWKTAKEFARKYVPKSKNILNRERSNKENEV